MNLNELRYNYSDFDNLYEEDMIIIYKGNIYPVYSHDTSNENIIYSEKLLNLLSQQFPGIRDRVLDNTGHLKTAFTKHAQIDDAFWNFVDVPHILVGNIEEGDDGMALNFIGNDMDIRNSKELNAFMQTEIAEDFSEILINDRPIDISTLPQRNQLQNIPLANPVYHGTSEKYIQNILSKGIRTDDGHSNWGLQNVGYVFMAADFSTAEEYANHCAHKYNSKPIVLEINTDRIDRNKIVLDYDFAVGYSSDTENSPYNITDNNRRAFFRGNVTSNQKANGTKYNKFGYKGVVMPNAIAAVYVSEGIAGYKKYSKNEYINLLNNGKMSESKIIDEVSSNDISLKSFEVQDELNPKFWVNDKLNSRVRLRLLDIADDFIDELSVKWVKPEDIVLTGSIANYNWSKYSDVDVHILMDYKKIYSKTEFVKDYFDSKKEVWAETHQYLKIYGFPVEMYVEDINEVNNSSGVYSLNSNKWIKEPNDFQDANLNSSYVKRTAAKFMTEVDSIEKKLNREKDEHRVDVLSGKMRSIFNKLKNLRKEGLSSKQNEMSSGNIIWKIIRRSGYLDKIWDVINKSYDRINSLK